MQHTHPDTAALAQDLTQATEAARLRLQEDPFGNPVLAVALACSRMMEAGTLGIEGAAALIRHLRDQAFAARATRLATYLGGIDPARSAHAMATLAARLAAPGDWDAFRAQAERIRFAAVFTAHPTFALPPPVYQDLTARVAGAPGTAIESHRPSKPTLQEEFDQVSTAIHHGRDALDQLNAALLHAAQATWPGRWHTLIPHPVIMTSWVGYDTDGRNDINWWDTIRFRLRMKLMQLHRLAAQLRPLPAEAVLAQTERAAAAVETQLAACPHGPAIGAEAVATFAAALIDPRDDALTTTAPLLAGLAAAIEAAPDADRLALCTARAGLAAHGLSLAHTHVRLNATQLHNALRQRAGLADTTHDESRRRAMLAGINAALDSLEPEPLDFGSVLAEQASASRLMMTVAQIAKHIDAETPIRFLIAETESGYTLLCALYLARLFGVADRVEISPLFETGDALERGARVLEEALRSPHWRDYVARTGKLCLQFGYSDSGRYVGQIAASYLIERLRLKIAETLARHGLSGVEIVLFDTHGESIGRGAHPGSMADRLKYLSPTRSRKALMRAGLPVREETAFQGGDGYLWFGSPALAAATIARIAEHAFDEDAQPGANRLPPDPVYDDPDFAADFFPTIQRGMEALVEDAGYAALLGTFGPALLDPTGSRPGARQSEGLGGPALIRHPSELRAIPNNAILQQLGWCANTLQGLGAALARHPAEFADLMETSPRFRRAMDFAEHALTHSDLDVLHAVIATLDPRSWLDRAAHAATPRQRDAMIAVSDALEDLGIWASATAMLRRVQADHLALRSVWPGAPVMATRELLLHALRLALVERIWLLAMRIPDFSPRFGVTRAVLVGRLLRLDVPATLDILSRVFPPEPDPAADRDYREPRGRRGTTAYAREHAEIFQPIARLFALIREIGTAITHEIGAFG